MYIYLINNIVYFKKHEKSKKIFIYFIDFYSGFIKH